MLKITNSAGKHAFIGIAFNERNDAFDFNVALSEHKKEQEREKNGMESVITTTRDLSLKEGEKIKINIGNMVKKFHSSNLLVPMFIEPPKREEGLLNRRTSSSTSGRSSSTSP